MTPTQPPALHDDLRARLDAFPRVRNTPLDRLLCDANNALFAALSTPASEAVAWMLRRKRDGFIRGCYAVKPSDEDLTFAEIDGDYYTPLYTHPAPAAMVEGLRERLLAQADTLVSLGGLRQSDDRVALLREAAAALSAPAIAPAGDYKPIERDESMGREYIPMPGGWEVQTQGSGSTFRIAGPAKDDRLAIEPRPYLHVTLTNMARAVNAAWKLAALPAAGNAGAVDDAMVERAGGAYWPWLGALGRLVCAAGMRDAAADEQAREVAAAHSELFDILRTRAAGPIVVDDAMIERAQIAWMREVPGAVPGDSTDFDDGMRAALTAALSQAATQDGEAYWSDPLYSPPADQPAADDKARTDAFHDGVILALQVLNAGGDCGDAHYVELVNCCGLKELVKRAKAEGMMELSGLAAYLKDSRVVRAAREAGRGHQ